MANNRIDTLDHEQPRATEVLLTGALIGTSGGAILAHTFAQLPMLFTVPFVVLPSCILIGFAILLKQKLWVRLRLMASILAVGGCAGALATVVYDIVRPMLRAMFGFAFNPFGAIPVFGHLMTGLDPSQPLALAAGWTYHFWNGISFGMLFALIRPRGGIVGGTIWGLGLAVLMLLTYPTLLHVDAHNPGFLWTDFVGHAVWGITLGFVIQKCGPYA